MRCTVVAPLLLPNRGEQRVHSGTPRTVSHGHASTDVYNKKTGALFYDQDGTAESAVHSRPAEEARAGGERLLRREATRSSRHAGLARASDLRNRRGTTRLVARVGALNRFLTMAGTTRRMVIRRRRRRFLIPLMLYGVSAAVVGYFVHHAHSGARGFEAERNMKRRRRISPTNSRSSSSERADWERRIALLRSDQIDRDLLEERARIMLGRVHRNDLVIITRRRSKINRKFCIN